jgi:3-oxoacyl-[acyl-carrier-protein] synthase II
MVAGGCESAVEALGLIGFSRLRALSDTTEVSDEGCSEASRPFDETRNGFVLAEGSAMLVLEEYSQAVTRKANILAEVVGIGYSGDAFHITAPEPSGEGAARAMTKAAEDASLANGMNDIDYINAHATSTPVGDVAELNAIRLALLQSESSEQRNNTPLLVSSTKGATGHLLGAAGAIEAALTVSAVSNSTVPPTQNLSKISDEVLMLLHPNDGTRLIHLVKNEPIQKELRYALSNSFGFGGANVSLLFTKCL